MEKEFDILIVDDEKVIIDAVIKVAEFRNLMVISASNGYEGLQKLSKYSFKLLLCDIMMPDMDGFEMMNQIRRREIKTPLIVTSGYSTLENAVKSLHSGAIDFLPKPFTFEELISSIERGLKYGKIIGTNQLTLDRSYDSNISFIPCPPHFYRLGYASWLNIENEGTVLVGISDLFLRTIENIIEINFLENEYSVAQGNSFMNIISDDGLIHSVMSPVSGKIIQVNEKLNLNLSLIEKDPYFKGWIYRVIPTDLNYELKNLTSCSSDRI